MEASLNQASKRIEVVDALRGLSLFAIVILHSLEHYNLYFVPENAPAWLSALDRGVWDTSWFLMGGKAFSIFSFLFGLSFHIQERNAAKRGAGFKWRFAWRMCILAAISQIHALFYNGDILLLYSVMGIFLLLMSNLRSGTLFVVAVAMVAQPLEWLRALCMILDAGFPEYGNHWQTYAALAKPVMTSGSFTELLRSNITDGQLYGNLWQIENGRIFQIGGLFLFGLLAGRYSLFDGSSKSAAVWKKALICSSALFIPFNILRMSYQEAFAGSDLLLPLGVAIPSICNFLFAVIITAVFVLLWYDKGEGYGLQRIFIPFGRMSLTNYILQSVIGVSLFYGFGFGLYKYTGATASAAIGLCIFIVLLLASRMWLKSHRQGPFERIWKRLTWIGSAVDVTAKSNPSES